MGANDGGAVAGTADYPWEVGKLVFVVFFYAAAMLSNMAVLAYVHDIAGRDPLPDIVFMLVPEISIAAKIGDILTAMCVVCAVILGIFHKYRLIIIRRMLFIWATLFTMRIVTLISTQLPPGYSNNTQGCRERYTEFSLQTFMARWGEQAIRFSLPPGKEGMLCGDMLFSGHTTSMMVCMQTVAHYLPTKCSLLRLLPYCFAYVGMACLIVSRTHYTIDVLIAYWLALLVFASYHAYAETNTVDRRHSVLRNHIYFMLVAWLEENIDPGRLENEFVNPIEAVKKMIRRDKPRDAERGAITKY